MKQQLRQRLRASRDSLSPEQRRQKSLALAALALPRLAAAQIVGVYCAMRSELDPGYVIEDLRARGCIIAYPRMLPNTMVLEFARVDAHEQLVEGSFQVFEPGAGAAALALDSIDTFLVPGLSFDSCGNRLGWGKGYYDYTLAQNPRALRVGLCFQEQIATSLPCDATDQTMDWIVTDKEAFAGRARDRGNDPKVPS